MLIAKTNKSVEKSLSISSFLRHIGHDQSRESGSSVIYDSQNSDFAAWYFTFLFTLFFFLLRFEIGSISFNNWLQNGRNFKYFAIFLWGDGFCYKYFFSWNLAFLPYEYFIITRLSFSDFLNYKLRFILRIWTCYFGLAMSQLVV